MTPTTELRYVERVIETPYGNYGACVSKTVSILQQKWRVEPVYDWLSGLPMPYTPSVEWRDVPTVKEET